MHDLLGFRTPAEWMAPPAPDHLPPRSSKALLQGHWVVGNSLRDLNFAADSLQADRVSHATIWCSQVASRRVVDDAVKETPVSLVALHALLTQKADLAQ